MISAELSDIIWKIEAVKHRMLKPSIQPTQSVAASVTFLKKKKF